MSNIISYSLWGNNPKYLHGAIRNADISKQFYPSFTCRFYVDQLVPIGIIFQLEDLGAEVVPMNCVGDYRGMFWRYLSVNENNTVLVRDCDSRFTEREVIAVNEWLQSDKLYHTIFDHPYHSDQFCVMPGLMGFKGNKLNINSRIASFNQQNHYGIDYSFFNSLYGLMKDELMVHDSIFGRGIDLNPRKDLHFIGEVYDENERTVEQHTIVLRNHLLRTTNVLYFYGHQGLGDQIDCNGMVRNLLRTKKYNRIFVFAKKKYADMISFMYRDEPHISVITIEKYDTYEEELKWVENFMNSQAYGNILEVGHSKYPWNQEKQLGKGCAEIFYDIAGIDFSVRFDEFYLERDVKEEQRVFDKLNPNNEDYIFVHDDKSRGYEIDLQKINSKGYKVIRNDMTENVFHFCKILEKAKEIHCMESAFRSLVETLNVEGNLYFHNFRPEAASGFLGNSTRQPWQEIKY